ncbi:MAG TPA: DUF2935 domain-containing protein [Acidimicrobiales bacterium]
MTIPQGFNVYTRADDGVLEQPYEKPVVTPDADDQSPAHHAWADARFATDIMSEHAQFFALLMPPELAAAPRQQALDFAVQFAELHATIDAAGPPEPAEVPAFCNTAIEAIKPFIEYKATLGDAQRDGSLRSLVWPLFFDHTRHEAERWSRRLGQLAAGESGFDRREVVPFWANIMDEHCRFVAHLLDPDEYKLIETALATAGVFAELTGGAGGSLVATAKHPVVVAKAIAHNPEVDEVMSAAREVLDFKTAAARDIEAARITSIIDPRLTDHVRREALKFVDELKRAS